MKKILLSHILLSVVYSSTIIDFTGAVIGPTVQDVSLGDGVTADITITTNGGNLSSITQGLGHTGGNDQLQAGEILTFTFNDIQNLSGTAIFTINSLLAVDSSGGFVFGDVNADTLILGGDASGTITTANPVNVTASNGTSLALSAPTENTLAFSSGAGSSFSLVDGAAFTATTDGADSFRVQGFDVSLDITPAAVPEPTSLALLGLGGLAFLSRRRR